jgi:hypothetical protein
MMFFKKNLALKAVVGFIGGGFFYENKTLFEGVGLQKNWKIVDSFLINSAVITYDVWGKSKKADCN